MSLKPSAEGRDEAVSPVPCGDERNSQTAAIPCGEERLNQTPAVPCGEERNSQTAAVPCGEGRLNHTAAVPCGEERLNQTPAVPCGDGKHAQTPPAVPYRDENATQTIRAIGTVPAHAVQADLHRRRARRQRARKGIFAVCFLFALLLIFLVSFTLTAYLTSPARRVPPLEAVLAMSDGEAADALEGFSAAYVMEAWGEPLSDYEMEFDRYGTCRYLLYKSPHSLDHVELYIPVDRYGVAYAEVWQVFRAYPVHIGRDGAWATVTPCPGEAETAYGDLIAINLATSRPAVLDSLDPRIPVIIYYKGTPTLTEGQLIPRISTVEEMHFYDNRLEPIETDEET